LFNLFFDYQALLLGENLLAGANMVLHKEWLQLNDHLSLSSSQLHISKKAKAFIQQCPEVQNHFLQALEIYKAHNKLQGGEVNEKLKLDIS